MRKLLYGCLYIFSACLVSPQVVFGHATPIEYIPEPSAVLTELPERVTIHFTERIEPGASSITIYGPGGVLLSGEKAYTRPDAHYYEIPLPPAGEGVYTVSWQVVSADDGHFTRGAFSFSWGSLQGGNQTIGGDQVQVIHASPFSESLTIAGELLGQALFIGALLSLIFFVRTRKDSGSNTTILGKRITQLIVVGAVCITLGTLGYIVVKSISLQSVQGVPFMDSLASFMTTLAGRYALYRLFVGLGFTVLFLSLRTTLYSERPARLGQYALWTLLGLQLFLRIRSSHAAASLFLPFLTQVDYYVHLFAKDAWVGILLALWFVLIPSAREQKNPSWLVESLLRISPYLFSAVLTALMTGMYIVWLCLKDFSNLLLTDWGKKLIFFGVLMVPLIALRLYHILWIERRIKDGRSQIPPSFFTTLGIEVLFGIALLYGTASSIITTPPILHPPVFEQVIPSGPGELIIREHPYDRSVLRIEAREHETGKPIVLRVVSASLTNENQGIGPLVIHAEQRSRNSFVLSKKEFTPDGLWKLEIYATPMDGYDLTGSLKISYPSDFSHEVDYRSRSWGIFETIMLVGTLTILLGGFLFMVIVFRVPYEAQESPDYSEIPYRTLETMVGIFLAYIVLAYAGQSLLVTSFEKTCRAQGDMWHTMVPTREGRIGSSQAFAGCMTIDGQYHFPDEEEYLFFKGIKE